MDIPENLSYTKEHEWLLTEGDVATVGITAYAADALGDVVYVELPEVGVVITAGESCGEVESTKSVSDLYAPVDGEVVEVNQTLGTDSALVNSDPFGAGWLFKVRLADATAPELLDASQYRALLGDEN